MAYLGNEEVIFSPTVNTTVDLTMEIDENSKNDECPSAKAVYDFGQFINSGSDPIVNIKTGEVVTTNDSGHKPLHGLNIYGKTPQNGTPTPDAPIDFLGVGESGSFEVWVYEKNMLPHPYYFSGTSTLNGVTYTVNDDWGITFNGTATADIGVPIQRVVGLVGKHYTISGSKVGVTLNARAFNIENNTSISWADSSNGNAISKVFPNGYTHIIQQFYIKSGTTLNNVTIYPQIEIGTQATPYEPCNKQTLEVPYTLYGIPVESGGNYTDANGQQWVCDEVDFENKCVIQRIGVVDLGTLTWLFISGNRFTSEAAVNLKTPNSKSEKVNALCSHYAVDTFDNAYKQAIDHILAVPSDGTNISIVDKSYTDPSTLKTALSGVMCYYELAEPKLYSFQYSAGIAGMYCPLSDAYEELHTNKPNTTIISADNAGQRVAYVADPKLYIDNKFTELENAILSLGGNV